MTLDLEQIKAAARAATPGPWHWVNPENDQPRRPGEWRASLRTIEKFPTQSVGPLPEFIVEADEICDKNMEANAAFIETMDPTTVLELVERLEAAEQRAGEMEKRYDRLTLTLAEKQERLDTALQYIANANEDSTVRGLKQCASAALAGGSHA